MKVRFIAEGDSQQCNDLQNRLHRTGRSLEQWKWTFARNTFHKTPTPYVVAENHGEIVGTQALIPMRMIDRDGVYWTAKSEETLLAPEYRGSDTFQEMYSLLYDYAERRGFASIWGLTGSPAAIKALTRMGFETPATTEQLFMPFSSRALSENAGQEHSDKPLSWQKRIRSGAIHTICALGGQVSSLRVAIEQRRGDTALDFRTMDEPDVQTGDVCRRFIDSWGGTTIFRDADYQKWRVFENPYLKAIVRALYRGDELIGWVSFALGDDGMGYLVDLMTIGDDPRYPAEKLVRTLLLEAIIGTRNMGTTGIRGWHVTAHPFDQLVCRVAKNLGFYHIRRGNAFVLYECEAGTKRSSYRRIDDWYVSRIYTEGVMG